MKAKLALIGDAGVGKTSLIRRFVLDEFDDKYLHTVGTKVTMIELLVPHGSDIEVRMTLSIFDMVGQPGFRDLVKESFYHGCQGLLGVCDVTKRATLDSLHHWISTATEICGEVPLVILVNKKDLLSQAAIREDDVAKVARLHDCPYAFTSAKTGEFVDYSFNLLAVEIVEKALRESESRRLEENLKQQLLSLLAKKGQLGLNKMAIFQAFKGVGYDDIERELERLEGDGMIRITWLGSSDFTVTITQEGEEALKLVREKPRVI